MVSGSFLVALCGSLKSLETSHLLSWKKILTSEKAFQNFSKISAVVFANHAGMDPAWSGRGGVHWFEIMSVKYARGICCSFKAWFHDGEIFRVKLFAKYGWLHLSDSIEFRHFFRFRRE